MNLRLPALLFAALLLAAGPAFAKKAAKAPDDRPVLAIVIVENLRNEESAFTDFDRLDLAFQHVAKERKWPVRIATERFAANTPDHTTELRIFSYPLQRETFGDITFRGWMTLTVQDKKHDFGIVTFRHFRRIGENDEDTLEKIFRGAANAAAAKIEPILFPKPAAAPKQP